MPDSISSEADASPYRRILSSSSTMGGAYVFSAITAILRAKVVALLLGPTGIGLIALLSSALAAVAAVSQLGLASAGTRQIAEAEASGDPHQLVRSWLTLRWFTVVLAIASGGLVVLLREPIILHLLRGQAGRGEVEWIALGVALSVAGLAQTSLLQGVRRTRSLALIQVCAALATTAIGLPLLFLAGDRATAAFVMLTPVSAFVLGYWYTRGVVASGQQAIGLSEIMPQLRALLKIGLPVMGAGSMQMFAALWVLAQIRQDLGDAKLGMFAAAMAVIQQQTNIIHVTTSMDYVPRLVRTVRDPVATARLIAQQTDMSILLGGPFVVLMFLFAPQVMAIMYSSEFAPAADLLRIFLVGSVFKLLFWPLMSFPLAHADGRWLLAFNAFMFTCLVASTYFLLPISGVAGGAMAYVLLDIIALIALTGFALHKIAYRLHRRVLSNWCFLIISLLLAELSHILTQPLVWFVSFVAAVLVTLHSINELRRLDALPAYISLILGRSLRFW